ncbi:MAG: hypothetical protein ABIU77_16560, partial [Ferruginibacter sp.]
MKIKLLIVLLCFSSLMVRAQQRYADSLKQVLQFAKNDSSKLNTLNLLSYYYNNLYPDSGIYYADKMIELADQAKDNYGKVEGLFHKSDAYQQQAKNSEALKMAYNALEIAEKLKESRSLMMAKAYSKISRLNGLAGKDSIATASIQKALGFITQTNYKPEDIINIYLLLGSRHGFRQGIDSAFYYAKKAYELFLHLKEKRMFAGLPFVTLASKYFDRGKFYEDKKDTVNALKNFDSTFIYMEAGIKFCREINAIWWVGTLYQFNILYCYNTDRQDSSLYYARQLLDTCTKYHYLPQMEMVNGFFSQWYQHNSPNKDSAIKYLQAVLDTKVRIANEQNISKFGEISFNEIQRQKDLQEQKKEFQTRLKIYGLLGIILIVLLITFFIYRGYRTKQRDIKLLQVQKKETETQKIIAEDALENLKSTQAQLVQSEKMASL